MQFKAITPISPLIQLKPLTLNPTYFPFPTFTSSLSSHFRSKPSSNPLKLPTFSHPTLHISQKLHCITPAQELSSESDFRDEEEEIPDLVDPTTEKSTSPSLWNQMIEIIKFSGPATGLWICGPLMSLIDTAVIGQGSSIELAALGPGTVLCDYMSYVFMFLSIATSNMVATSLARQDEKQVQHQISILLFVGLACGVSMLVFTKFFGSWALTAFAGAQNVHLLPAANSYIQIRALAWPAILVGWVAQSASLGMKDSMGPLKALVIASVLNGVGDIVLCMFLGYGIAGAAWATAISQIVAAYTMIDALNKKGYNGYSIAVPTLPELQEIFAIAAPVFITIVSKVSFYSLIIYFATSMGTHTIAAHQVLSQIFHMCAVWGEPLSQTAQSFMPELLYGVNRSLVKARDLLKSLLIIGASVGLFLAIVATSIPFLAPNVFTPDPAVIAEMHKVWVPFFLSLCVTPCILSCEGTLLAGRDLKFISTSMAGCFVLGSLVLLLVRSQGLGLVGCWTALIGFQWARFFIALQRLLSPSGILFSEDLLRFNLSELKTA
ncbi:protein DETOXIFICATION 46, chloroplastic-like [Chenopodium quinoa]|uniref:protein DETOXIFICATION 46, chloroplastic-like n=1 Tax=Chenopodium quinoa TaxID=63459 RepID=UPI000B775785|nr:protein DETOXIFICATION 46, chloroplastic-like [Chenopodium quinoa]